MYRRNADAYTAEYYDQHDRIINSSEARVPICFCVDVSQSMDLLTNPMDELIFTGNTTAYDGEDYIQEVTIKPGFKRKSRLTDLQKVMKEMLDKMLTIPVLRRSAICCIISFSQFANCEMEFTDLSNIPNNAVGKLKIDKDVPNVTNFSRGIKMALSRLDQYTQDAENAGNDSYKPVLIFMSDGKPTDGAASDRAAMAVRERSENGTLKVIPIAIGNANEDWLKRLNKDNIVYRMQDESEFRQVFDMITRRVEYVASVIPVDEKFVKDNESLENHDDAKMASAKYGEDATEYINNEQSFDKLMQESFPTFGEIEE